MASKLIFAYTPHVIMPPYVNIYHCKGSSDCMITLRTQGQRDTSAMEIPREQLKAMAESILKHLEEVQ